MLSKIKRKNNLNKAEKRVENVFRRLANSPDKEEAPPQANPVRIDLKRSREVCQQICLACYLCGICFQISSFLGTSNLTAKFARKYLKMPAKVVQRLYVVKTSAQISTSVAKTPLKNCRQRKTVKFAKTAARLLIFRSRLNHPQI